MDSERQSLDLNDRHRERFEEVKEECTEGGKVPKPSDEDMLSSLMDTWDAVNDGLYSEVVDDEDTEEAWKWLQRELREARKALWDGQTGRAFASIEAAQDQLDVLLEARDDE